MKSGTPETLEVPVWVRKGTMLVHRDALPSDDPESTYQYILNKGFHPEDYGYFDNSLTEEQRKYLGKISLEALSNYVDRRAAMEEIYGN